MGEALSRGERVSLTFHGAATAIYVWLNGVFVGYAEDSYTPSEFDVTEALHAGRICLPWRASNTRVRVGWKMGL